MGYRWVTRYITWSMGVKVTGNRGNPNSGGRAFDSGLRIRAKH